MLKTFYRSQNITTGFFFLLIATVILRVQCTDSFADAGSRKSVLRIRDVYPGSDFFPSRIPDPNFFHPSTAKEFVPPSDTHCLYKLYI